MKFIRNPWPYAIAGFFILFLAGVATILVIAARQNDSLVSKDYYEQEIRFQGQMDAIARAKQAGAAIRFDAVAGKVFISLPAEQMKQKPAGKIVFYRASASELDREFPLEPQADGVQLLEVSPLAAGSWRVRVNWTAGGREFYLEEKIVLAGK
jgi:hypothetical protein